MKILKSLIVTIILFSVFAVCCYLLKNSFSSHKNICLKIISFVLLICSIFSFAFLWDYIYPFERKLNVELIAEITLQNKEISESEYIQWQAIYEKYGLYPESFFFYGGNLGKHLEFELPKLDLEKYTYIITYGRKIDVLSYNVWETIDYPIHTGAKEGHMVFEQAFFSNKIFIYRLKKMRIDNPRI